MVKCVLSVVDNGDVVKCLSPYVKAVAFWKEGRLVAVEGRGTPGGRADFLLSIHAGVGGLRWTVVSCLRGLRSVAHEDSAVRGREVRDG